MLKKVMIGTVSLGVLLGGIAWLLGDSFRPWTRVLRAEAKDQLEELVDRSKLELAKSEEALEQAHHRAKDIRNVMATTNAQIARLEADIRHAQRQIDTQRASLEALEERLKEGKPVTTVSGRALSVDEVRIRVQDYGQRIELAEQKITLLDGLLKRHQERRERFREVDRQAPTELARLELSVKHLAEKVKMYEDYRIRLKEDKAFASTTGELFADAQRTLEAAHEQVDTRLAEFDARMKLVTDAKVNLPGNDPKEALADIRRILDQEGAVGK